MIIKKFANHVLRIKLLEDIGGKDDLKFRAFKSFDLLKYKQNQQNLTPFVYVLVCVYACMCVQNSELKKIHRW